MPLTWTQIEGDRDRETVWDDLARSCGYATFFHTRAWAALFARTLGTWRADPLVMEFSDGNVAVLPMMRRLDSEHLESTIPGIYGGPLFVRSPAEEHLDGLDEMLRKEGDLLAVANPYAPFQWEPNGLVRWGFHTYRVDLAGGFGAAYGRFRRRTKRSIQKGENACGDIRFALGASDARAYFDVYEDNALRFGSALKSFYPPQLFENLVAMADHEESVRVWLASLHGQVVSGLITLNWGDVCLAWHCCTRSDSLDSQIYSTLVAAALRRASEEGLRWFDFLGSVKGTSGAHFKEGFAAVATRCTAYWSPYMTSADTRSDTGPGAAQARLTALGQLQR